MLFVSAKLPTPIDADPAEAAGAPELVAAFRDAVTARREAELRCARLLARMRSSSKGCEPSRRCMSPRSQWLNCHL